jgi:divalent metal cation (Fe/Co/Zn/Cd) transporter
MTWCPDKGAVNDSIRDLVTGAQPRASVPGRTIAAAALLIMPLLAVAKRATGRALGNRTLIADSAETAFCAATSATTLAGVGLNAWACWWQAGPSPAWPSPPSPSKKASKPGQATTDPGACHP